MEICLKFMFILSGFAVGEVIMAWNRSLLVILALIVMASVVSGDEPPIKPKVKTVKGKRLCDRGWECTWSTYCCNLTITDYFETYQFENLFAKRNSPVAHAVGFWDFHSFILAAAQFEPLGFGTTGDKKMQMREIAAFLGHVGSRTSCGDGVVTGGPLAWGLCFNREMSPSQDYCNDYFKLTYPCAPGAQYYGRGAIPIFWFEVFYPHFFCQSVQRTFIRVLIVVRRPRNYNYGKIGDALKLDLLNHPEYVEQNATIAFQTAMWMWMNPVKKSQPSPHDVFVGNWKPTKNDTPCPKGFLVLEQR
ncbi:Chitinase-like protein 1, partial [Cucurbita argyrosperma subsp. sororia]